MLHSMPPFLSYTPVVLKELYATEEEKEVEPSQT